ncbi:MULTISPECIES: hypothetical protein [Helcococcus]|uniref:LPXTG cell wall anchor domain-containing protein n=1 Tax=Helcococcus bovis TaxID=3153252 RepID=A0ABW9F7I2_9FIRM
MEEKTISESLSIGGRKAKLTKLDENSFKLSVETNSGTRNNLNIHLISFGTKDFDKKFEYEKEDTYSKEKMQNPNTSDAGILSSSIILIASLASVIFLNKRK